MFNTINEKDEYKQCKEEDTLVLNEMTIFHSSSCEYNNKKIGENPDSKKLNYYAKKRISLYKTEMCRSFEETGLCKYGDRCQFAHARKEVRGIERHPRYKTETCRTFWEEGTCPYGKRCCFIHLEQNSKNRTKKDSDEEIDPSISMIDCKNQNDDLILGEINFDMESEKCEGVEISNFLKNELTFTTSVESVAKESFEWKDSDYNQKVHEYRPFWHTNEALKWGSIENMFCYISHRNYRYNRVTDQPKAPGEPVIYCISNETQSVCFDETDL